MVPCFGHKAAAVGNMKWAMWLKFNAGRWKKEPCFSLPCSCSKPTSGAKRNWPHWLETAEQTPHCTFYKCNRAAHLQKCQGKYTVSPLFLWPPSPILLLKYLHGLCCCCRHLCLWSQQRFLSHLLWQVGGSSTAHLQHSKKRNINLGLGCIWKCELLYLCLSGRCRLILLAYYLALNVSLTELWKSQSSNMYSG